MGDSPEIELVPFDASNELEHEISITWKGGAGFDAPWVVVRVKGRTPEQLTENAERVAELVLKTGLFEGVQSHAVDFINAGVGRAPAPAPAAQPGPYSPNGGYVPGTPAPDGSGPACGTCGGPTVRRDGTYKNGPKTGQPYSGWFCADRNSRGHKVTWLT